MTVRGKDSVVKTVELGVASLNTVSHHKYLRCAQYINPVVRRLSLERGHGIELNNNRNSLIVIDANIVADAEEIERGIQLERDVYEEKLESELESSLETILEPVSDNGYESDSELSDSTGKGAEVSNHAVGKQEIGAETQDVEKLHVHKKITEYREKKEIVNTDDVEEEVVERSNDKETELVEKKDNEMGLENSLGCHIIPVTEPSDIGHKYENKVNGTEGKSKNVLETQVPETEKSKVDITIASEIDDTSIKSFETNVRKGNDTFLNVKVNDGNESESDLLKEIYKELNKRKDDEFESNANEQDTEGDVWVLQDEYRSGTEHSNEPDSTEPYQPVFADNISEFKLKISGVKNVCNHDVVEYNVDSAIREHNKSVSENTNEKPVKEYSSVLEHGMSGTLSKYEHINNEYECNKADVSVKKDVTELTQNAVTEVNHSHVADSTSSPHAVSQNVLTDQLPDVSVTDKDTQSLVIRDREDTGISFGRSEDMNIKHSEQEASEGALQARNDIHESQGSAELVTDSVSEWDSKLEDLKFIDDSEVKQR